MYRFLIVVVGKKGVLFAKYIFTAGWVGGTNGQK
jgi:hypothetical protein